MMKIAYFLDIAQGLGGAGNLLLQQAKLMSDLYEVIVIVPCDSQGKENEEYARRCERYGLEYRPLEYTTAFDFCSIDMLGAVKSVKAIEELVKKERISFFHSVQLNIAAEYVARKLHIPHIMDIYQLEEEEFVCCQGDIYPHYHLCDSKMYMKRWSRCLGVESRCVRPVALQEEVKRKKDYSRNEINILMLGSVCARKNQLTAIKACEICMKQYSITLTIAGDMNDVYANECVRYVKEKGLEEKVIFTGFVSDIVPLLEENDCLLCTSCNESFPSSMVEALSYDLCIISTPVAGVPEVFVNEENAFVSKDFSLESIVENLDNCLRWHANESVKTIHECARYTWNENFSRQKVRKQIAEFYEDVKERPYIEKGDFDRLIRKAMETKNILLNVYSDCEEMERRALYHAKIKEKLAIGKIYLWGAGKMGGFAYKVLHTLCPELEIVAFVDKNKKGEYYGVPIIHPEELPIDKEGYYGVCFGSGREMVIDYLQEQGLSLNKQIWILP